MKELTKKYIEDQLYAALENNQFDVVDLCHDALNCDKGSERYRFAVQWLSRELNG
jgi:hypothetical protein